MMLLPLFSFFATVVALWLFLRTGLAARLAMDTPNHRSLHTSPVPRIGGLALVPAFLLSWLWLPERSVVLSLLIALLALLSYLDDRSGLPVMLRLLVQLAAAALFVALKLDLHSVAWGVAAVLWIVWCTNLYNFMDGADGLAGGMALFGFSAFGFAAFNAGNINLSLICFSAAAASAGFLLFNFAPAKIFMGDAGSIALGFLVGALGLSGWQMNAWPLWFPVFVFSPFILDATVTLLKRLLRGERVWQAHHDHYYQRLVRMGWSHRRLALCEYALMAVCGVFAALLLNCAEQLRYFGLLIWVSLYAVAMIMVDICWKKYQSQISQS
jgi:UDP-N-acetylmuramyl pentapeptide phosphotransferase/UDP-N-acetylglucosamine-1-phosphate transferase